MIGKLDKSKEHKRVQKPLINRKSHRLSFIASVNSMGFKGLALGNQ